MTNYEYLKAAIDNPGDDCIVWRLGKFPKGYGQVRVNGKGRGAHAVALEITTPRPVGKVCSVHGNWVPGNKLDASHGVCHNTSCFNPKHLSWKTKAENAADKERDGTHQVGENHPCSTIPQWKVDSIKAEYKGKQHRMRPRTGPTTTDLAYKYGCSQRQVMNILEGRSRSVA